MSSEFLPGPVNLQLPAQDHELVRVSLDPVRRWRGGWPGILLPVLDARVQRLAVEESDLLPAARQLFGREGWVGVVAPHQRASARHVSADRPWR